jgi:hypothetical protein
VTRGVEKRGDMRKTGRYDYDHIRAE